jgi:hypothetical protein|tara:strand:+ start:48197 stop:48358 length:162 start_codon:yes stop_codon:yes gene_type:complete
LTLLAVRLRGASISRKQKAARIIKGTVGRSGSRMAHPFERSSNFFIREEGANS